jgi:hypothetical protein
MKRKENDSSLTTRKNIKINDDKTGGKSVIKKHF